MLRAALLGNLFGTLNMKNIYAIQAGHEEYQEYVTRIFS